MAITGLIRDALRAVRKPARAGEGRRLWRLSAADAVLSGTLLRRHLV